MKPTSVGSVIEKLRLNRIKVIGALFVWLFPLIWHDRIYKIELAFSVLIVLYEYFSPGLVNMCVLANVPYT